MYNKIQKDFSKMYMSEFNFFDGEYDVTFNILDINLDKSIVKIAVSVAGKIYTTEYDLFNDKQNNLYFEYGCEFTKIYLKDFENAN